MTQALLAGRTTLERSCSRCIRAKRRCDRQFPSCSRCQATGGECRYGNQPLNHVRIESDASSRLKAEGRGVKRKRATPDHSAFTRDITSLDEDERRHLMHRVQRMTVWAKPKGQTTKPIVLSYDELSEEQKLQTERWRTLLCIRPSVKGVQLSHSARTIAFMVGALRSYPQSFHSTGRAPFIHPLFAGTRKCDQPDSIFKVCFSHPNEDLHRRVYELIDRRPQDGNLEGLLTAIQGLLLALMTLLFSPSPIAEREARRLLHTLATWTQILYKRLPQRLPSTLEPWPAWVFAESVRRTFLISFFLVITYTLKTTGKCLLYTFYTALPFDGRTGLWDNLLDPGPTAYGATDIMSYKEYVESWRAGSRQLPADSKSFETLLSVGCCGYEAVDQHGDITLTGSMMGVTDLEEDDSTGN